MKYNANGGKGAAYSQIALKADGITIKSVAELKYTKNGFTADTWNTNENGYGADYAASQKVNDSLTLFAMWSVNGTTVPTVDDKVKLDDQTGEYILVMSGEWKNEKTHTLKATIDGKAAPAGSVSWRVNKDSYKKEFGFEGNMTDTDIVEVTNAVTGAIKVRNSGIVRVEGVSNTTQKVVCSVVVIVPGDVDRDGMVTSYDAPLVMDYELGVYSFPTFSKDDHKTWFWKFMADVDRDNDVGAADAGFILDLELGVHEI